MKTIYLIRHGESQSNANKDLYFQKDLFDHTIELSPQGVEQARNCGKTLSSLKEDFSVFVSPYLRAQQTWKNISESLGEAKEVITDGRIREQEFKDFPHKEDWAEKRIRAKARGKLYYRYKNAESGLDVLNRVGNFYNQLRMDMLLGNRSDTVVIVCHEIVIRCFLTIMEDLPYDQFETLYIENCEVIKLTATENLKFSRK